jgi:hypothetical protein
MNNTWGLKTFDFGITQLKVPGVQLALVGVRISIPEGIFFGIFSNIIKISNILKYFFQHVKTV